MSVKASESKEMLISTDFCGAYGVSAEPFALAQLPVCESYSTWQRLLKPSQEYLKHMSVSEPSEVSKMTFWKGRNVQKL